MRVYNFSERDVYSEDLLFKLMFMAHAKKNSLFTEAVYLYRVNDTLRIELMYPSLKEL